MNILKSISSLLFSYFLSSNAEAQRIKVVTESFEVSTIELADLMTSLSGWSDNSKLYSNLLKKAKAGEVKLLKYQALKVVNGNSGKTENLSDFTYPTKFKFSASKKNEKKEASSNIVTPAESKTRELGSTLQIQALVDEFGKIFNLTIQSEVSKHSGDTIWGEAAKSNVTYNTPVVYTLKTIHAITLTKNKFHFVSTYTPKDDKGKPDKSKRILVFVKADTL